MGVGGRQLSPIPKYDDNGREIGFYGVEDVPHDNRFGLPPAGAEMREGYNARNAPFGAAVAVGVEHLSSVRETYLQSLAEKTGLTYAISTTRIDSYARSRPPPRHDTVMSRSICALPRSRGGRRADRALHLPASFRMACRRST